MEFYLLVFKNTTDALNGETAFKERNIVHSVYPTPPQILGSCGISLRITHEEIKAVNAAIDSGLSFKALYKITRMSIMKIREFEEK